MRLAVAISVLAISVALSGGCSEDEPSVLALLGGGCLLNSDCDSNLVCVFERCHIQCAATTDCPVGEDGERLRCVIGDKPEHVCQLADETTCSYHSQCPGNQICGPDARCRDQCQDDRDCVEGQQCAAGGACADTDELDADGELSGEQPPPNQTGFPCAYDSQCVDISPDPDVPYVCRDGGCNVGCYQDIDCDAGFVCAPADKEASAPGFCDAIRGPLSCVPNQQVACPCFPDGTEGFQVCLSSGMAFGNCVDIMGNDCAAPQP